MCGIPGASQTTTCVCNLERTENTDICSTDNGSLYHNNCSCWITTRRRSDLLCIIGEAYEVLTFGLSPSHRQHLGLRTGPSQDRTWRSCLEGGQSLQWALPHWRQGTAGRSIQTGTAPFPVAPTLTTSETSPSLWPALPAVCSVIITYSFSKN